MTTLPSLVLDAPGQRTMYYLSEWRRLTGESQHQAKRKLLRAEREGLVRREGMGTATRWFPAP